MKELHLPWLLEITVLLPLIASIFLAFQRDADKARRIGLAFGSLTLGTAFCAWIDFAYLHTFEAHDHWDFFSSLVGFDLLVIDELNAPLLPLVALMHLLTMLATLRSKVGRFSFARALLTQSITLATFSCRSEWPLVLLLSLGTLPMYFELRVRKKPTRVFAFHFFIFIGCLVSGMSLVSLYPTGNIRLVGILLMAFAVLLRNGVAPVHCWLTDLFEHASFGSSLLYATPMVGAYAAMRLVLPIAPDWALRSIAMLSLMTAVYASGMALVQKDSRRFFCFLFLSHSSLVLVGLESATPLGLAGALCVWLSVGLALTGFGLTLRCVEARTGRLRLDVYHGLYEHMPSLAAFFLLTGLASVGFPGTIGFIATELLIDAAVELSPVVGTILVISAALNGIAILHAYFRVFTGTKHQASISLASLMPERIAVLTLSVLIIGGGLWPQPSVESRYQAAIDLLAHRELHQSEMVPPDVAIRSEDGINAAEKGFPETENR